VRSMTGYGRGVAERGAVRVTVEVRAVNHRFLDVKLRGAAGAAVEDAVATRLRERLERGAVTATVRLERAGSPPAVRIDRALARDVHAQLADLARELGTAAPTLREVVSQPGVITVDDAGLDDADAAAAAGAAAGAALDGLIAMRTAEGATLAADLVARLDGLAATVDAIAGATADGAATAGDRLRERLARLLEPGAVDPVRLAQEVAILADRADVTEELVRARSHLDQLRATLTSDGPVGRRLDFLTQELGREVNTIGAKTSAAAVAHLVVAAKAELEKIREQVQNLE